tara:strand:+ start:180 stop:1580 length:1401 start_codon:yes stop_codon:yes gene_type:complete
MGTVYNTNVVTDGLIACWDAGNRRSYPGTGTVWTDLVGGHDGTLENGVTLDNDNMGIMSFDGTDTHILIPDSDAFDFGTTGPFSISCWVKANSAATGIYAYQCLFYHHWNPGVVVLICTPGGWEGEYQQVGFFGGSTVFEYGTSNINDNEWHYVAVTRESDGAWAIYVDEVMQSSGTGWTGNASSTDDIGIGKYVDSLSAYYPLLGNLNEMRVYNIALSADQVLQNYNATKRRYIGTESDSLVLNLDAGDTRSYPGAGASWHDLALANVATFINGPTLDSDGRSIRFDGTNEYATIPDYPQVNNMKNATISVWMQLDTTTTWTNPVSKDGNSGYYLQINSSAHWSYGTSYVKMGGARYFDAGGTYSAATWYMYTGVVSDPDGDGTGTVHFYRNGSAQTGGTGSATGSVPTGMDNPMYIGAFSSKDSGAPYAGYYLDGQLATVQIWDRALTAAEILDLYNKSKGRFV